jgi:hypothetical protein
MAPSFGFVTDFMRSRSRIESFLLSFQGRGHQTATPRACGSRAPNPLTGFSSAAARRALRRGPAPRNQRGGDDERRRARRGDLLARRARGVETISVDVLGPERTITDRQLVTETQVVDRTQTDVVTKIQPTTVVVTDLRTETVREVETQHVTVGQTETVVVTQTVSVTVTVPPPP